VQTGRVAGAPMMIGWFLVARRAGRPASLILAHVTELVIGPLLYAIVPGCGPAYAFPGRWLNPPAVEARTIRLSGMPNAFPSLHVGTALVFVLFAPTRLSRAIAVAFLAGTVMATLSTGEHYVIDGVAGLVFGCFTWAAGCRKWGLALGLGGLALAWPVAVRFGSGFLLEHPDLLKGCAGETVLAAATIVVHAWLHTEPAAEFADAGALLEER